jgi:DNA-binding response OmpR family regulator
MGLKPKPITTNELAGARILVAEDEILIALDIRSMLIDAGAEVIGPATTIESARTFAQNESLTAATLDIRLGRKTTETIAAILSDRGIPFIFYSGQPLPPDMGARWPQCPVISKPGDQRRIVATLVAILRNDRPPR